MGILYLASGPEYFVRLLTNSRAATHYQSVSVCSVISYIFIFISSFRLALDNLNMDSIFKNTCLVFSLEYRDQPSSFWRESIIGNEQQYKYFIVVPLIDERKIFVFLDSTMME